MCISLRFQSSWRFTARLAGNCVELIESVSRQLYSNWELCVAVDASTSTEASLDLKEHARKDARIKLHCRDECGSISACTNDALAMASSDWIVLLDARDTLSEHAFYLVAETINRHPNASIIYSDEDCIDAGGKRYNPYFKPDWDYDLFLGQNLIGHLVSYRSTLAQRVGGFREGFGEQSAGISPFVFWNHASTARSTTFRSFVPLAQKRCSVRSCHASAELWQPDSQRALQADRASGPVDPRRNSGAH